MGVNSDSGRIGLSAEIFFISGVHHLINAVVFTLFVVELLP